MRTTNKTGRGKHLFVDGSDPICAVILRPKSLRASWVAPVHIDAAYPGGFSRGVPASGTQRTTSRNTDLRSFAHICHEEMT
jgi:hypothetical protein